MGPLEQTDVLDDASHNFLQRLSELYRLQQRWMRIGVAIITVLSIIVLPLSSYLLADYLYERYILGYGEDAQFLTVLLSGVVSSAIFLWAGVRCWQYTQAFRSGTLVQMTEAERWEQSAEKGHRFWRSFSLGYCLMVWSLSAMLCYEVGVFLYWKHQYQNLPTPEQKPLDQPKGGFDRIAPME